MIKKGDKLYRKFDKKYYTLENIDFVNSKIVILSQENLQLKYHLKELGIDLFFNEEDSKLDIGSIANDENYTKINENLKQHKHNKNNYRYLKHCFNCNNIVDSFKHKKCPKCGWYICSNCGKCGCDYEKRY